jgi:hypothetical protein
MVAACEAARRRLAAYSEAEALAKLLGGGRGPGTEEGEEREVERLQRLAWVVEAVRRALEDAVEGGEEPVYTFELYDEDVPFLPAVETRAARLIVFADTSASVEKLIPLILAVAASAASAVERARLALFSDDVYHVVDVRGAAGVPTRVSIGGTYLGPRAARLLAEEPEAAVVVVSDFAISVDEYVEAQLRRRHVVCVTVPDEAAPWCNRVYPAYSIP